jgi:hypothetical protein
MDDPDRRIQDVAFLVVELVGHRELVDCHPQCHQRSRRGSREQRPLRDLEKPLVLHLDLGSTLSHFRRCAVQYFLKRGSR